MGVNGDTSSLPPFLKAGDLMSMINIEKLNKTFESGTQAVKDLSLVVETGEILGLLGPNGAGKTTTVRVMSSLCGFDSGKVMIAGEDMDLNPDKIRQAIGYVAQQTGVDNFLTGRENLQLFGRLYRIPASELQQRIEELAQYFEFKDSLDRLVATYSGGMRRKLDIAAALIHRPQVLFLDEPTLGLDIKSRKGLWHLITRLNQEMGLTILLTTHYLEEADKLAHRVAIINQGQIQVVGTPEELKQSIKGDAIILSFPQVDQATQDFGYQLGQEKFVKDQIWQGERLYLYCENSSSHIAEIIKAAEAKAIKISNLSLAGPSLDDVFIKYTGTSIEKGEEESGDEWWKQWAGKGGGSWGGKWKNWQEKNQDDSDAALESEAKEMAQSWPQESDWQKQDSQADQEQTEPEQSWPQQGQWSKEQQEQWSGGGQQWESGQSDNKDQTGESKQDWSKQEWNEAGKNK